MTDDERDAFMNEVPDPPMHYDRLGVGISLREWSTLLDDDSYRVIASDVVGSCWVSTVWLGLNYEFLGGPPMIFETMVFNKDKPQEGEVFGLEFSYLPELECQRYSTEAQARDGHTKVVHLLRTLLEAADDARGTERHERP